MQRSILRLIAGISQDNLHQTSLSHLSCQSGLSSDITAITATQLCVSECRRLLGSFPGNIQYTCRFTKTRHRNIARRRTARNRLAGYYTVRIHQASLGFLCSEYGKLVINTSCIRVCRLVMRALLQLLIGSRDMYKITMIGRRIST